MQEVYGYQQMMKIGWDRGGEKRSMKMHCRESGYKKAEYRVTIVTLVRGT